jgi:outer membrane protein OmpA-like peptidoglycan-associated protein
MTRAATTVREARVLALALAATLLAAPVEARKPRTSDTPSGSGTTITAPSIPRPKKPKGPKQAEQPKPPKQRKQRKQPKPPATQAAPAAPAAPVAPRPARATVLPRTLSPLGKHTSDETIARDLWALEAWRTKLDALPRVGEDVWRAAAAKAWLEAARVEYTDDDRQGFPQAAFEQAVALISEIEAGTAPVDSANAPPARSVRGSTRVADSLYARLESLKHNPGFRCGREPLAQMEVELAWAGNERIDQGDCQVTPHLARASELADAAQQAIERCLPPPAPAKLEPAAPEPQPDTVISAPVPTEEELRIPRNVHFALGRADIGEVSRPVIAGIVALLQKYPSITVRLVGHTDSRGSPEFNLELSRRRVEAVRAEFVAMGIDSTRLTTDSRGKSDPYAIEDSRRGFALNRRVDMVFVDAQGRDIKAQAQEGDLQLEVERGRRAKKPPATRKPAGR